MKKFDSINLIPFIDIMLVLLTIVLTTSTFITKGMLPVELPNSQSKQKVDSKPIVITITKEGKVFVESQAIALSALKNHFNLLDRKKKISINCDKSASFNYFVEVMDTLKALGFHQLSIVTKI